MYTNSGVIIGVGTLVPSSKKEKSGVGTSVPLGNIEKNGTKVPAPRDINNKEHAIILKSSGDIKICYEV